MPDSENIRNDIKGLDPLPGGEMPRRAENPSNREALSDRAEREVILDPFSDSVYERVGARAQAERDRLRAENERLREELEVSVACAAGYMNALLVLQSTLERLDHLIGSPGSMSRDEIRAEGRRLIAETRGASDEEHNDGA
jgi:hypothetical protein